MSSSKCHLDGCNNLVALKGDGAAISESVKGVKVFFCSLGHWTEFSAQAEAETQRRVSMGGPVSRAIKNTRTLLEPAVVQYRSAKAVGENTNIAPEGTREVPE